MSKAGTLQADTGAGTVMGEGERAAKAMASFLDSVSPAIGAYLDACVRCGLCADACHFHAVTGDPRYTPIHKLKPFEDAYRREKAPFRWLTKLFGTAPEPTMAELEEWEELVYDSCTMCGRCTAACPMGIDIAAMVAVARKGFAAAGLGPPDLVAAAEMSRDHGSPLGLTGETLEDRLDWLADEDEIDIPLDRDKADILLTVSSIEAMKYPASLTAMARIMNHAGLDWTFSTKGYEATNFGYLSGRTEIAREMVGRIVAAAETAGASIVVIPECGHAFGVMRWSAAGLLGRPLPFEVLHISEFMARLKREGRLKLRPLVGPITYHDPCQISRRGGATEDARDLLDGFAEDFREMEPAGVLNWCCGGGGGVQAIGRAADLRHEVFRIKMDQVAGTGATTMVSACANCRLTFDESKAHWQWEGGLASLVEIIADHLDESDQGPCAGPAAAAPPPG